ncbi:hypothetical protein HR059_04140 [Sinorhizobium meliloti WSM1022]|jgi:hypothetical protein|uniref:Uncharacterized protein n=3 Tax=Sinorhizobium TaxID=28105 RepID=H0FWR8_RHIML|nr:MULTISPECIES: hypothetical protein [Sinorhizobium]PII38930.1 membrane protein [Sinorhizobium meliloti CCBAU 01290]PND20971.1 hypothetical protein CN934_14930 [Ensifer sp. MMN_5]GCA48981.1 hypothetical protein KGO5_01417 [Sinorhizobium sp. KGO-5]ASQ04632.1 hypothetical protein CDO23_12195 [Sinorhizobium meliloti]EHK78478.1 hypothetical protein SM0020_08166 [Sinorhizobium meliloti CCNWSX0020]
MAALVSSAILSLRLLILAGLLIAPIGAVAYSKAAGYGIGKNGAGFVLFVTLQRQAMS